MALTDSLAVARRVGGLATQERTAILVVILLGLASAVFEGLGLSLLIPLASLVLEGGMEAQPFSDLMRWAFGLEVRSAHVAVLAAGVFSFGLLIAVANLLLSTTLALRYAERLRGEVFEGALTRPISMLERLPPGKTLNIMATESWRVCDALFIAMAAAVDCAAIIVLGGFLIVISPLYSAVLAVLTVMTALAVRRMTRAMRKLGSRATAANEDLTSYLWNALTGIRVVRGFGREAFERRRFHRRSARVSAVFKRLKILSGLVHPVGQLMSVMVVATLAALAAARGDDLATLIGFLAIAFRLQPRVSSVLSAQATLLGLEASVAEVERALAHPEAGEGSGRALPALTREIFLDRVTVRYAGADTPALRNVTCAFRLGEITAVAGRSGAGKSTLVGLLLRFVSPESGRVLVDGAPLTEIDPIDWHSRIAFVEQNAFLFDASVRANIGYGRLGAGMEAVRQAARLAQADEFIAGLENGYDTLLGAGGVQLSQGQRQRVALARALLRDPDVLVLDEATNALDRVTERALREALRKAGRPRVVIVIAHRRETIENADAIIVLDEGEVVETGAPDDLARADGLFTRLYRDER